MRVLLFILLFTIAYRIYADCPNGTFSNLTGDRCYFIPNESLQFVVAEMNCRDQNADLASISNAFDNSNLQAQAENILGSNVTYVWLGGRKDIKGTWIWSDGGHFCYTNWATGNPDNNTDDNCMALNLLNGHWYSQNCYNILPYICDLSLPDTTHPPCSPTPYMSCFT